jgi:hypothetical protein
MDNLIPMNAKVNFIIGFIALGIAGIVTISGNAGWSTALTAVLGATNLYIFYRSNIG